MYKIISRILYYDHKKNDPKFKNFIINFMGILIYEFLRH